MQWLQHHTNLVLYSSWHQAMKPNEALYGLEDESRYGTLTTIENGKMVTSRTPTLKGDWPHIYREFASAIQQGSELPVTGEQARDTIKI